MLTIEKEWIVPLEHRDREVKQYDAFDHGKRWRRKRHSESGRKSRNQTVFGKFVIGGIVIVVSEIGGNMIVNVKDSRVAISKEMANKIMV